MWTWKDATRAELIWEDTPSDIVAAVYRPILIAQLLYAFAAALCLISTYGRIAFIVQVQVNYVVALPWPSRR